ncbi:probable E3 ubiquitin-protein ligase TRIM8 [Megalops cyprinoides]|uniref:probable E3 ubiquitin-protein ligase TRIM8 n=1 Tax=Megalops cyprinoides TaxID=118141 RepID=UPI001864138E|nr:probable E3 ubiquitin-protein ligase TRIM8 [Megalops cyprinoides]
MESVAVDDELICAVCRDTFVQPVTLPCGHNYCEECVNLLKRSADGGCQKARETRSLFSCPLCLAPCETGIDLKKNSVLCNIIEKLHGGRAKGVACTVCKGQEPLPAERSCIHCAESYCTVHIIPHLENEFLRKHMLVEPRPDAGRLCKQHGREVELYCETDCALLCVYCMLPSENPHLNGHNVVKLADAMNSVKEAFQVKLGGIRDSLAEITDGLQKLEEAASVSKDRLTNQQQEYSGFLRRVRMFVEVEEKAWQKRLAVAMVAESRRMEERMEKLQQLRMNADRSALWAEREAQSREQASDSQSSCCCALGSAGFSRGAHYWEVEVRGIPSWALGISCGSGHTHVENSASCWVLIYSQRRQQFCTQHHGQTSCFAASRVPVKIGLFLDVDSGILSFYDAELLQGLYTFYCQLNPPAYPLFCLCLDRDGTLTSTLPQEMRILTPVTNL